MYIKSILIASFLIFLGGNYLTAQDYEYVGAAKCKMCHNKPTTGAQYKIWSESKHAHAMESLKGDEKKDPKCLKCHSTAGAVSEDLIATITVDEGVSCESCHGPGSAYKSNSIMKDLAKAKENGLIIPTKELCVKCHNSESPNFKGFDFDEYMKKIAHPIPKAE